MTEYRIYGSEMSPYSTKVRSYFRYKGLDHTWIQLRDDNRAEYQRYAKLPIVPTVVSPTGEGLQDSTPIIEAVEAAAPEPSIHPEPPLAFLSTLIEEFGDEWGNKLMFHHRWWDEIDRRASARTLARLRLPQGTWDEVEALAGTVYDRMTGRGHFVGSSTETAEQITSYFVELLDILEPHLTDRRYLFGARPAFADFGLSAQLYMASIDPTCGGILRGAAPSVLDWCYRMIEPVNFGPFESWETLAPTLQPLLGYVGRYFLPWSEANARALEAGEAHFTVDLAGRPYSQAPQKYHAKSLAMLKRKYAAAADKAQLDPILDASGCKRFLI